VIDLIVRASGLNEVDPDKRAEMGMRPSMPLCQRCNRETTERNPIFAAPRKTWNPFERNQYRHFDFICVECRELLKRR
jgi:hypothetical protein